MKKSENILQRQGRTEKCRAKLTNGAAPCFCPVRDLLGQIGDKWSVLTLLELHKKEVMRFNELSKAIPDVSQKMLTVTLRALEGHNLITRKIYPEVPPRVEYRLTEVGNSLMPHIEALIAWALENRDCVKEQAREAVANNEIT